MGLEGTLQSAAIQGSFACRGEARWRGRAAPGEKRCSPPPG